MGAPIACVVRRLEWERQVSVVLNVTQDGQLARGPYLCIFEVLSYVNSIICCKVDTTVGKRFEKDRGMNHFIPTRDEPIEEFIKGVREDSTYVACHCNCLRQESRIFEQVQSCTFFSDPLQQRRVLGVVKEMAEGDARDDRAIFNADLGETNPTSEQIPMYLPSLNKFILRAYNEFTKTLEVGGPTAAAFESHLEPQTRYSTQRSAFALCRRNRRDWEDIHEKPEKAAHSTPVKDPALWNTKVNYAGKVIWLAFGEVVILTEQMKKKDDLEYQSLLEKSRKGTMGQVELVLLNKQVTSVRIANGEVMPKMIKIVKENKKRAQINHNELLAFAKERKQTIFLFPSANHLPKAAPNQMEIHEQMLAATSPLGLEAFAHLLHGKASSTPRACARAASKFSLILENFRFWFFWRRRGRTTGRREISRATIVFDVSEYIQEP
ncbi:hypothetical protein V502_09350 [Pseudogymnoascus sp. VKM F-4520 (FW-2644)]|nr:hypothetical protein V502_09350 [Pseudogymnoascus sp. VKM F-4520 (FW-2644)]